MTLPRGLTLLAGTGLILGLCYAVAAPNRSSVASPSVPRPAAFPRRPHAELELRCRRAADDFRRRADASWSVGVHPPFVLAGDLSEEELNRAYHDTIVPVSQALSVDYFDREPDEPIRILILASDDSYRRALQHFGYAGRLEYSGLYERQQRMLFVNAAAGIGTLTHELTHALAHADFPQMPEWFDEGLASLHEDATFSSDERHLLGQANWRRKFLLEALARNRWKPLSQLLDHPFAEPDVAALDYALARDLCLFLQERGLLAPLYRKCRAGAESDPTGGAALLALFPGHTLADIDQDLRDWLTHR